MRLILLTLIVMLMCAAARGNGRGEDPRAPEPGISRELARWRAQHYKNIRYALSVVVLPGAQTMNGTARISLTLDNPSEDLVLDWRMVKMETDAQKLISQMTVNDKSVADARFINDHIVIPSTYLRAGENVLKMKFESPISASGSAVTRYRDREDNSEYVYTLFVPSDASTAFPCFDQPDLKARFQLSIEVPDNWQVVSNTTVRTEVKAIDDPPPPRQPEYETKQAVFHETEPLSTYQFAFAAGPFAEFKDESSPYGTRLFVRKSKAERARKELQEVFRLNREGVKFFEQYFAHKFPFPKYDLVILPEFPFRGMEHAGATFLREETILFPSDPTAADIADRAEVILHEAAHQWFGDLVTMRWFDDLWLKEGFATFMAYKAAEQLMPEQNAWQTFHLRTKPLAYLTDVTKGTTPIWQEIPNLSAAKSAYGNIVYRKAPSVLRQAEFYLGADKFQRAIQTFVREHAYSNAEWADLVRAFERASNRKLAAWADAWVKRRGMPDVRVNWTTNRRGRITSFTVAQRDALGEGGAWPMKLELVLRYQGRAAALNELITVTLDGNGPTQVNEVVGKRSPDFVFANHGDYGYGRFLLDDVSRTALLRDFGRLKEEFLRALMWGSLWESVRETELSPASYIELALREAQNERDEVVLQSILARVQTAYTRYLTDAQRQKLAQALEGVLLHQSLYAETAGQRITYFRAYRDIASTPASFKTLGDVLAGRLQVPGMTLRARDRFDIVRTMLAARGDGKDEQVESLFKTIRDENKTDDGRRYAYAAEAARPLASSKQRYFDDFTRNADIPESWIEAAFVPFNTPQHAALTLPHLDAALRELPALKRTRKIFFVNGWLAAFIGGQCNQQALDTVNNFLSRETNLDRDLRLKVLEATDGLERCVRIRAKYAGDN